MVGRRVETACARHRRSRVLAIAVFLLATAVTGCEFVTTTPAPRFLNYVLGEIGVEGKLPDPLREVDVIPLATTTSSYVAILSRAFYRADNDELLLFDDGFQLRIARDDAFPVVLNRSGIVTDTGNLLVGNLLFDPVANVLSNSISPDNYVLAGVFEGGGYYLVRPDSVNFLFRQDMDINFNETSSGTIQLSTEGTLEGSPFAHEYVDSAGNRYIVVIADGAGSTLYVVTVPSTALPGLIGPLFSEANPSASVYPTVAISAGNYAGNTIKTRDGIITYSEDSERFDRFDATTGAKLDSFEPGGQEGGFFDRYTPAFFVRGGNYLLLDHDRKRLYEVAPWW